MKEVAIVRGADGIIRVLIAKEGRMHMKVYRPTKSSVKRLKRLAWRHNGKVEPFFTSDYLGFKLYL